MRKALLAATALAAIVLLLPAAASAYYLPSARVAVKVAPDGSLLVKENITITGAFHGAYRDIPLRKGESIDRIQVSENGKIFTRGGSTELGSIDTPDTFNYDLSSKKVRIVWHFDAAGEARTFTVAYRFRGLAVAYDDVDDVVVGDGEAAEAIGDRERRASPAASKCQTIRTFLLERS